MPDEKTHADALRFYLSGASSHEGAQTDPDAAIGNYRGTTEWTVLSQSVASAIANVTIAHVAGANGEGAGTLTASGASELKWTPPGGTLGAGVTIANGETKILEGGTDTDKYVRVTRTSAAALSGTATVTLTDTLNNAVGLDDVSSAEAAAGDDEQRGLYVKNESTVAVTLVKAWVKTIGTQRVSAGSQLGASGAGTLAVTAGTLADWDGGSDTGGFCRIEESDGTLREIVYYSSRTATELTVPAAGRELLGTSAAAGAAADLVYCVPGIRLSFETPSHATTGYIENCATESAIPTAGGIAWSTAISAATAGCSLATLAAGNHHGLRIRRAIPAGMVGSAERLNLFDYSFDAV